LDSSSEADQEFYKLFLNLEIKFIKIYELSRSPSTCQALCSRQ